MFIGLVIIVFCSFFRFDVSCWGFIKIEFFNFKDSFGCFYEFNGRYIVDII